jgi:predicted nucleotidyltransferase
MRHTHPRAILLVGSVATGIADCYSDLDMLLYYDQVPPGDAMAEAARALRAEALPRHNVV